MKLEMKLSDAKNENLVKIYSLVQAMNTAWNNVISPNFLVLKFCGKTQYPHRSGAFPKNFHAWKLGDITVFYPVKGIKFSFKNF